MLKAPSGTVEFCRRLTGARQWTRLGFGRPRKARKSCRSRLIAITLIDFSIRFPIIISGLQTVCACAPRLVYRHHLQARSVNGHTVTLQTASFQRGLGTIGTVYSLGQSAPGTDRGIQEASDHGFAVRRQVDAWWPEDSRPARGCPSHAISGDRRGQPRVAPGRPYRQPRQGHALCKVMGAHGGGRVSVPKRAWDRPP